LFWKIPSINWTGKLLSAVAINRQNDIFLAATNALYKTEMTGQVWEKLNTVIGNVEIVKMDANGRLYAVGRRDDDDGLYCSLDLGKTWKLLHRFNKIINIHLALNNYLLYSLLLNHHVDWIMNNSNCC